MTIHLNHSWPSDRLVVSLISHFFTDTQNTTYTTERVEEKRINKHGLGLAQEGWSLWHFPSILWAITSVNSSEIPTRPLRMLTHLLTLANSASQSTGSSSHLSRLSASPDFCRLLSPVDCAVLLLTGLFCSLLGPSFPRPLGKSRLVGNLARKPFVWISRQNRQRNLLTGTYPPNEYPHRVTIVILGTMSLCANEWMNSVK